MNNKAISKLVTNLVKNLSTRNKDIISRRFGLKSGKRETLESIGRSYGITRERVRQIEEFSLGQLTKMTEGDPGMEGYSSSISDMIIKRGGIMKEADMFKEFSGSSKESVANASLVFLLTLVKGPVRSYENDSFHSFWAVNGDHADSFKGTYSEFIGALNRNKKLVPRAELVSFARINNVSGIDSESVSDGHIDSLMDISKGLGVNVFNEVGLVSWADVKPKGVRDKAYLVLKRDKSPKHFTDITKLINSTGFSNKKANVQTVHNELIKDARFVLVGRGMYGLSEWGYSPGTVKDVLVSVLKKSGKPMKKSDLVAKVTGMRMVKENTILLNLQDSKVFAKKDDGSYTLRKA
jgi:hypothetical protein